MRETARSAHVWDKGWETALAAMQGGGSGKMAENRMAQGMQPGAFRLGFRLQICLGARGVRDLLSGDRAEFGFPLAPAGSCAVFFQ